MARGARELTFLDVLEHLLEPVYVRVVEAAALAEALEERADDREIWVSHAGGFVIGRHFSAPLGGGTAAARRAGWLQQHTAQP